MAVKRFNDLPDEIAGTILGFTDWRTALAIGKVSRRLRDLSNEPKLWKQFCREYRWWKNDVHRELWSPDSKISSWKSIFEERMTAGRRSKRILKDLITNPLGRIEQIDAIVKYGDYGIKNELMKSLGDAPKSPDHLAQRYWTHVTLGRLHRLLAIQEWQKLKFSDDAPESFEISLAAFDMFILNGRQVGDFNDISERLDYYAERIRREHPGIDSKSPRMKAEVIARHLLENKWVGISHGAHYHALDHMFVGVALHEELKNSLPLVSAVIYSAVCRRFGLRSAPCSFPFHVHAVIQPPEGFDLDGNIISSGKDSGDQQPQRSDDELSDRTRLYIDPFHTAESIPLASMDEQLAFIARRHGGGARFMQAQRDTFLSPTTPREICLRNAHNILRHEDFAPPAPKFPIDKASALYSALWCLNLLTANDIGSRQHLGHLFQLFIEHFSVDLPVIESQILPLGVAQGIHHEHLRSLCAEMRRVDIQPRAPKLHSDPRNHAVKYRVGQVFRHRMRGYLAVINGWDPNCDMTEEWIVMNQVRSLERGRDQPFYNVLVEDTSSRYVAEDNVVLLSAEDVRVVEASANEADVSLPLKIEDRFPIEIGKFFKRFDRERGVFISNILDEFPED